MKRTLIYFSFVVLFICSEVHRINGQTWHRATGIPEDMYIYEVVDYGTYAFAAGMYDIYRSDDHGQSWTSLVNGVPSTARAFSLSGEKLYVASSDGLYFSTDWGDSWTELNLPYDHWPLSVFVDDSILLAGVPGGGIYRSSDYGENWYGEGGYHLYKIATFDNTYYAGSWDTVLVSNEYGMNWHSSGLSRFVYFITGYNDTVYVCTMDDQGGIMKTHYSDVNWTEVGGIHEQLNGIVTRNDTFYVVSRHNAYYAGISEYDKPWKSIPSDGMSLPDGIYLWSVTISGNNLIAGTATISEDGLGSGVWYYPLDQLLTYEPEQAAENLFTISPNPARNKFNITCSVPESFSIALINASGTIIHEQKGLTDTYGISCVQYPHGLYFLKVQMKDKLFTRKVIIY